MSNVARLLTGASALGLLLALAACNDDGLAIGFSGGYKKVPFRETTGLPQAPAPEPPRAIAGFGAGAASTPTLAAGAPADVTQDMVVAGQQAFGTICVACHGPGGAGTAAGPQLSDASWINIAGSFDEIANTITAGVPTPQQFPAPMPPMGGGSFTPVQVRELAAYVFSISHAP